MVTFVIEFPHDHGRLGQYVTTPSQFDLEEPLDNTFWPVQGDRVLLKDKKSTATYEAVVTWRASCPWKPSDICWGVEADVGSYRAR